MRVAMLVAMTAMLVAGVVLLEAYDDAPGGLHGPTVLVGAYLVARVTHAVVFVAIEAPALRRRALLSVGLAVVPSGALLVSGALLGDPWQLWFAIAAVALEPLAVSRSSANVEWRVHSTAHFAERYGLIVILALGESIIAIGVGVADEPIGLPLLAGVLLAALLAIGMWWAYFSRLAESAESALARLPEGARARAAADGYTYLHLVVVAGIVLAALGLEEATAHAAGSEPLGVFGAAALGGGVACFLAGTAAFAGRVIRQRMVPRFVGASVCLALVPVLALLPPLGALLVVVIGLAGTLAGERWRARRAELPLEH